MAKLTHEQRREILRAEHWKIDAIALDQKGQYREAEPLYRKALAIHRKALGEDAQHGHELQQCRIQSRRAGEACRCRAAHPKALTIRRKVLGEDHPDTATSYNNVAANLNAQGKYAEAAAALQKALAIPQGAGRGPPRHGRQLQQRGLQPERPGQVRGGRAALPEGAGDPPQGPGRGPPRHGHQLQQRGRQPERQGKYAEAEPLYQKALAIRRKVLGEDHPDTAASYNNVASNLNAQGKYAEAAAAVPEGAGDPPQGAGRGPPRHGRPATTTWPPT